MKGVIIKIGGVDLRVRFTWRANLLFEEATKKSVFDIMGRAPSISEITELLIAGTTAAGENISRDELLDLLDKEVPAEVYAKMIDAFLDAQGDVEEGAKKKKAKS